MVTNAVTIITILDINNYYCSSLLKLNAKKKYLYKKQRRGRQHKEREVNTVRGQYTPGWGEICNYSVQLKVVTYRHQSFSDAGQYGGS